MLHLPGLCRFLFDAPDAGVDFGWFLFLGVFGVLHLAAAQYKYINVSNTHGCICIVHHIGYVVIFVVYSFQSQCFKLNLRMEDSGVPERGCSMSNNIFHSCGRSGKLADLSDIFMFLLIVTRCFELRILDSEICLGMLDRENASRDLFSVTHFQISF